MGVQSNSKFAHRENRDGTYDSICKECFATVATARCEPELADGEREHICDPLRRERFRRDRNSN